MPLNITHRTTRLSACSSRRMKRWTTEPDKKLRSICQHNSLLLHFQNGSDFFLFPQKTILMDRVLNVATTMIDVLIILKGHTQRRDYLIWHFVLRLSRIWSKVLTLKCHWAQWAEYIWIFNSEYHTVEATLFNWRAAPFADQKSGSASSTLKWSPHLAAARGSHFKKTILNGWFHCGFEVNFPRSSYQCFNFTLM